jgi:hypothetical protein
LSLQKLKLKQSKAKKSKEKTSKASLFHYNLLKNIMQNPISTIKDNLVRGLTPDRVKKMVG